MRSILIAATVATLVSSAAWAGQPVDWNGSYIGLHVGAGYSAPGLSGGAIPFGGGDLRSTGITAGITAGRDWQSGQFVYGVAGDLDYLGFNEQSYYSAFDGKTDSASYDLDWVASARARAGMSYPNGLLVYGTAGVAAAHVSASSSFSGTMLVPPYESYSDSGSVDKVAFGGVAGMGLEYRFKPNWSMNTEYLQYFLSDVTVRGQAGTPMKTFTPNFGTVRIGVSYHF